MKLYASPMSPYSARVRASFYFKDIAVEMIKPSSIGGMGSPAFLAVTPIGKIPVLVLDDGTLIVESDSIVEYLEDTYPEPALRPRKPEQRARARMVSRVAELYVMGSISAGLSVMMPLSLHRVPEAIDAGAVAAGMPALEKGLDNLDRFLCPDGPFVLGADLSTADAAVTAFLPFVRAVENEFGRPDLIASRPRIEAFSRALRDAPVLSRIHDEVADAIIERRAEIFRKYSRN
jgi:glutathione S-transferase